jgi:hypothetical protein
MSYSATTRNPTTLINGHLRFQVTKTTISTNGSSMSRKAKRRVLKSDGYNFCMTLEREAVYLKNSIKIGGRLKFSKTTLDPSSMTTVISQLNGLSN